jgi:hypothetical protein
MELCFRPGSKLPVQVTLKFMCTSFGKTVNLHCLYQITVKSAEESIDIPVH